MADPSRSPLGFERWDHGRAKRSDPAPRPWHVQQYDDATWVMRQSKADCPEAPFVYLLRGENRALLLDTGDRLKGEALARAQAAEGEDRRPLRQHVDSLIGDLPLIVAHTHGHYDHIGGDDQFTDRADTTLVSKEVEAVQAFFGFEAGGDAASWPHAETTLDLGNRELTVTGIPGHHRASIAIADPRTGWLLPGDTVYPGRLYVEDFPAFVKSIDRLVDFAGQRSATAVLGCHNEMTTTPGRDHPLGCNYQPDEPPLEMPVGVLSRLQSVLPECSKPGVHRFDEFIVVNGMGPRSTGGLMMRALGHRIRERVAGHSSGG